jgi:pectate lyase
MKKQLLIAFLVMATGALAYSQPAHYKTETRPTGFASVPGEGITEVKGGEGGQVIFIQSGAELETELAKLRTDKPKNNPVPTIFVFSGAYTYSSKMMYVKYIENVTLVGDGTAEFRHFGLIVQYSKNIVIRNIIFDGLERQSANSSDDGICIERDSHHVWVDHCTFTDHYDGSLDTKRQARNVSISWNRFYNHSKNCLVGHDDKETADAIMTTTFHHNFFDGTQQRNPRVRFGKSHVYNNYYTGNSIYAIVSACNAKVFVEGNYLINVAHPSYCGYDKSPVGDLEEQNNVLSTGCGAFVTHGTTFNPSDFYEYELDDPNGLNEYIPAYAGAGKVDFSYIWLGGEPPLTGLSNPVEKDVILSETYYSLSGIKLKMPPAQGLFIKKTVYANGRSKAEKQLKNKTLQ